MRADHDGAGQTLVRAQPSDNVLYRLRVLDELRRQADGTIAVDQACCDFALYDRHGYAGIALPVDAHPRQRRFFHVCARRQVGDKQRHCAVFARLERLVANITQSALQLLAFERAVGRRETAYQHDLPGDIKTFVVVDSVIGRLDTPLRKYNGCCHGTRRGKARNHITAGGDGVAVDAQ